MLDHEITTLEPQSAAMLMQKLHVDLHAQAQRNALSFVFHAVQGSYAGTGKSLQDVRKETFDFLYKNLELRSRIYEQFVDSVFPDHEPHRRAALAVALICDEALRQSAKRNDNFAFGGFDEETVELALTFYEEAQDLAKYGAMALSAEIEPESLFLAHIDAIDALSVIESNYKDTDPKILRDLGKNFFTPTKEFLLTDNSLGRNVESYMRSVEKMVHIHLAQYAMMGHYLIPDNDTGPS